MNFQESSPEVCVLCSTYNHYLYIEQCLKGFIMQKTDFLFSVVVVDDASTDGEQDILWNFIEKELETTLIEKNETDDFIQIIAPHRYNKNCIFAVFFLKYNHFTLKKNKYLYLQDLKDVSKYIATCEGDDYWIDPLKLQKQVDFLNTHPEHMLCFTRAKTTFEPNAPYIRYNLDTCEDKDYSPTELVDKWIVPTASMLYRKEIENYKIINAERFISGDIKLFLSASAMGKVRGMSDYTCTYRVHNDSLSRNKLYYYSRLEKYSDQYICILENFPQVDSKVIKKHIFKYNMELFHTQKSWVEKIKCIGKGLRYVPKQTTRWILSKLKNKLLNRFS